MNFRGIHYNIEENNYLVVPLKCEKGKKSGLLTNDLT